MEMRFEKILLHYSCAVNFQPLFWNVPKLQKPVPEVYLWVRKFGASQYSLLFEKEYWKQICTGRWFLQTIVPQSILRSFGPTPNKQGAEIPKDSLHPRNRHRVEDGEDGNGACVKPGVSSAAFQGKARYRFFNGTSGKSELSVGRPRSHGGV